MNYETENLKSFPQGEYIGRSDVPLTPSLVGSFILNSNVSHKKQLEETPKSKTYTHRYPRTASTYMRTSKAIEIMRYTYHFSMNNTALGLQISSRTVKKHIDNLKDYGFKVFNCMRSRLYRSKNSSMMQSLRHISARIQSYIDGQISLLQLYINLGIDPP